MLKTPELALWGFLIELLQNGTWQCTFVYGRKKECKMSHKQENVTARIKGLHTGVYGDFKGLYGNVSEIHGNVSRIKGNATGVTGDVSNIVGSVTKVIGSTENIRSELDVC